MIARAALASLRAALAQFPCVLLVGLRQVGKSTLAETLAAEFGPDAELLRLREPAERERIANAEQFLSARSGGLVVLDEVHLMPEVLNALRGQVERRRRAGMPSGHFLLLGSDSARVHAQLAERLGGHLAVVELDPLQPFELDAAPVESDDRLAFAEVAEAAPPPVAASETRLWVRGGLPLSFDAASDAASYAWRRAYVASLGARPTMLDGVAVAQGAFATALFILALHHGEYLPVRSLAETLGCSQQAARRFAQHWIDQRLLRALPQWSDNPGKRFASRHKFYLRDAGLLHAVLELPYLIAIESDDVAGRSWEGHALERVLAASPSGAAHGYYRTGDDIGELDIVVGHHSHKLAIEVKKSGTPKLTRAAHRAIEELRPDRVIVVYRGVERYCREDAEFMGLRDALREVAAL